MKDLRRCSSTIREESILTCCNAQFSFFLPAFSLTNIHNLQDSMRRGRLSLYTLSTTPTRITDTQTLAGLLLQRALISAQLAAGIKHSTFGTCYLEFTLSTLALVAAVVMRILKTCVTLGNISRVFLSLFKRFPCFICLVCFMISIFDWEEFIYGTFEDCIGLFNSHYCFFYFRISTR